MRKQALLFALALMLGSGVAFSTGVPAPDAANAAGNGKGGGGAGGGGEIPDYGDLIILHRDDWGVPIPSPVVTVTDPETGEEVAGGQCWQPIAVLPPEMAPADCADCVALLEADGSPSATDLLGVPVDQYNCSVLNSTYTQEVDFGRINQARSPVTVFESQLEDVVIKLATAYSTSLDPAGRMVASTCGEDEMLMPSTIDSPLQNLAIYRQLMLTGTIGPDLPAGATAVETAASGLGVASDKGGEVNVDMVAYLNQVMGLDEMPTILDPKRCVWLREEVQGVIQLVEKCFLDYGANTYNRATNFGALPSTGHIGGQGNFEYLSVVLPETDPPQFRIAQGPITTAVFPDENGGPAGFEGGNIGAFAQAADDTRAVINFMHDWPMPDADVYGTPLGSCDPGTADISYDISISDVSGLQVPKNVVDGSSDREFIVTVANAGPDDATVTLTVTATPVIAGTVLANLVGDDANLGFIPSPFEFPTVDIPVGGNHAFSALISVDIGQRTTINWTAEATSAEPDVNLGNNSVTAVSNVKVTGGGRR